tara:strand:+ start:158 stop:415 length:258 start_codon:yes stop_codon:yes gene_type:complete
LAEVKGNNTTLQTFHAKTLNDIKANEKMKSNHPAVVGYHIREGNNIPVYDTQSAQWMKPVWEILDEYFTSTEFSNNFSCYTICTV